MSSDLGPEASPSSLPDEVIEEGGFADPSPADSLVVVPPASRFCHRCGTAWDLQLDCCPTCSVFQSVPASVLPGSGGRLVALALVLYFIFLGAILGFAFLGPDSAVSMIAADIFTAIVVLAWAAGFWSHLGKLFASVGRPLDYLLSLALAGVTFGVASLAVYGLNRFFDVETLEYVRPFLKEGYGWGVIVLSVCVQPAIIEEIAFRGVIFTAMERILSPRDAVIISALLFMVIHLAFLSYPHLLLMGLTLGWLRVRTGSLYPGMLLHFTHNLLVLLTDPR